MQNKTLEFDTIISETKNIFFIMFTIISFSLKAIWRLWQDAKTNMQL